MSDRRPCSAPSYLVFRSQGRRSLVVASERRGSSSACACGTTGRVKNGRTGLRLGRSGANETTGRLESGVDGPNPSGASRVLSILSFSFLYLLLPVGAQSNPQLAEAAVSNPAGFRQLYSALRAQQEAARREEERQAIMLNSDPYNIEAQRKIEETIRQQAVEENLETAMENMPEA